MFIGFCLWITARTLFLIFRFPVCCQRGTFVFWVRVFWWMSENRVYVHRFFAYDDVQHTDQILILVGKIYFIMLPPLRG